MPTVNYVGVSRRIENEQERRRLRQLADRVRPKGMGVIVRTAAEGATEKELADDIQFLLQIWNRVEERSRASKAPALVYQDLRLIRRVVRDQFTDEVTQFLIDSPEEFRRVQDLLNSFASKLKSRVQLYREAEPIFEHTGVEKEIEKALHRKIWLKSGGYIVIDRTEALTVIDVNTGKFVGKTDLATTIFRTNMEAVGEIVRQITLRDIGGIILADFIDMENEGHRKQVLAALHEAARRDRSKFHIIDLTQLGLVEITRKRVHQDLEEVMRMPCPYCEGRGRVLSVETMGLRVRREIRRALANAREAAVLVDVHPDVAAFLSREGEGWIRQLEQQTGRRLRVRAREGMHIERLRIVEGPSLDALERAPVREERGEHVHWLDYGPPEVVTVGEEDEEQELAMASAGRSRPWMTKLRRLLGRTQV
jgi:ribonuclease G